MKEEEFLKEHPSLKGAPTAIVEQNHKDNLFILVDSIQETQLDKQKLKRYFKKEWVENVRVLKKLNTS